MSYASTGATRAKHRQDFVRAETAAGSFGIRGEGNAWTYVLFAFLGGSGFARDPLYPWAITVLNDRNLEGREKSVALYQRGVQVIRAFMNPSITVTQTEHV